MTPSRTQNGLEELLQDWAEKVRGQDKNAILGILKERADLSLLFPDFRLYLADYAVAVNAPGGPKHEQCLQIEKWFRGEAGKTKNYGNVPQLLAAFAQFVRYMGYLGWVVMMDEAESITLLSKLINRDQANENLRQFIDNADLEGFYFLFASTPSFLGGEDDRGAKSYPALWRRIRDPLGAISQKSLDKVIIELPALSETDFVQLARRIKEIYEIADGQPADRVTEAHLQLLAKHVRDRADKSLRTLVRSTVMLLDEARAEPGLDVTSRYELLVETVLDLEERERAE